VEFTAEPLRGKPNDAIEDSFKTIANDAQLVECLEFKSYTPQVIIDNIHLLSHLQRLEIGVGFYEQLPVPKSPTPPNTGEPRVPSLRTLVVHGYKLDQLVALTQYLTCPLEVMELYASAPTHLVSWLSVFKEHHQATLKRLRIEIKVESFLCVPVPPDFIPSMSGF
jgi:hypothetical protein